MTPKDLINVAKAKVATAEYKVADKLLKKRNKPLPILIHPNPILAQVAKEVDFEKMDFKERTKLVVKMGHALAATGYGMQLGLAAPQIGVSLRVIIVRGNVMFNPSWKPAHQLEDKTEACYSVPHKMFTVNRARYGWAQWQDINGVWHNNIKITGDAAHVFQHELDHLNGKCCIDTGKEILRPSRASENEEEN